jgi:hypothetical protein
MPYSASYSPVSTAVYEKTLYIAYNGGTSDSPSDTVYWASSADGINWDDLSNAQYLVENIAKDIPCNGAPAIVAFDGQLFIITLDSSGNMSQSSWSVGNSYWSTPQALP